MLTGLTSIMEDKSNTRWRDYRKFGLLNCGLLLLQLLSALPGARSSGPQASSSAGLLVLTALIAVLFCSSILIDRKKAIVLHAYLGAGTVAVLILVRTLFRWRSWGLTHMVGLGVVVVLICCWVHINCCIYGTNGFY